MIDVDTLPMFVLACIALILTPGPDMALTLTRGMTQGFQVAAASVLGTWSAGFVQIPAVVLGLATVFQHSPALFQGVKTLGAIYLAYLGARSLLRSLQRTPGQGSPDRVTSREACWQGFLTNLFNPKVLIFLTAFLPQFTNATAGPVWRQLLLLAVISKMLGLVFGVGMALAASYVRRWMLRNPWFVRLQEGVLGSVMLLIALVLMFDRGQHRAA